MIHLRIAKAVTALALCLIGFAANAENPKFSPVGEGVQQALNRIASWNECIVAVDEMSCKSGYQQVTPLDTFVWEHLALFERSYRASGIYRWHDCRIGLRVRDQRGIEQTTFLSSYLSEFETCSICVLTSKAPNEEKRMMVEADAAKAHIELIGLQGSPAFCNK